MTNAALLLAKGANINLTASRYRDTVLAMACKGSHHHMNEYPLQEDGIGVDGRNENGITPVKAMLQGFDRKRYCRGKEPRGYRVDLAIRSLRLFFSAKLDLEIRRSRWLTSTTLQAALDYATYGALAEVLRAGATVHVRNREGIMRLGNVALPPD